MWDLRAILSPGKRAEKPRNHAVLEIRGFLSPDYQTLMLPLLRIAAKGESTIPRAVEILGKDFHLTLEQMSALLPSGGIPVINNRAHWAKTYLVKAGVLEQPRRGVFRATDRGIKLLQGKPIRIDNRTLEEYPEFRAFTQKGAISKIEIIATENARISYPAIDSMSPDERIALAAKEIETSLKAIFWIEYYRLNQ